MDLSGSFQSGCRQALTAKGWQDGMDDAPNASTPCHPSLQLLAWEPPWAGTDPFVIVSRVADGARPVLPDLESLRGPNKPEPQQYEVFCQLIRCVAGQG